MGRENAAPYNPRRSIAVLGRSSEKARIVSFGSSNAITLDWTNNSSGLRKPIRQRPKVNSIIKRKRGSHFRYNLCSRGRIRSRDSESSGEISHHGIATLTRDQSFITRTNRKDCLHHDGNASSPSNTASLPGRWRNGCSRTHEIKREKLRGTPRMGARGGISGFR